MGAGARAQKVEPRLGMSTLVGFVTSVDSLGAVRVRPPRTFVYMFYNYAGIYCAGFVSQRGTKADCLQACRLRQGRVGV